MHASGSGISRPLLLSIIAGISAAVTTGCAAAAPSTAPSSAASAAPQSSSPQPTSSPGHDTPEDAVTGYMHAILTKNWKGACLYEQPSVRSYPNACPTSMPADSILQGQFSVPGSVISGDQALVEVTGRVCIPSGGCLSNANPSAGMPSGTLTFGQAYTSSVRKHPFSPVACVKVGGEWYIAFP